MKLHEYQSKRLFAKYGVPIPPGDIATTPAEARQVAEKLGGKVVVKCQVLVGGRGKAGGIKVAKDAAEAARAVEIIKPARVVEGLQRCRLVPVQRRLFEFKT